MEVIQQNLTPSQSLINDIIRKSGYSKSRISRETGISRRTLTNIYNGQTLDPNHRTFRRLLALYCNLFYLHQSSL